MTDFIGSPVTVRVTGLPGLSAYELYATAYLAAHGGDPTGMLSPADWLANAGMTFNASGIAYGTGTVQQALDALSYSGMHVTAFTVSPPQAEIGSTVATVSLAWTLNRNPTSQTINGTAITPTTSRATTYSNVTSTTNYTLVATDSAAPGGASSDTLTKGIAFLNKVHAGTINKSNGATLTSADVNGMSQSAFDNVVTRTFSFTTTADGYIYYSQSAFLPDPTTFKVGGFVQTPIKTTRSHTTATGHTENYNDFLLSDITSSGTAIVLEVIA